MAIAIRITARAISMSLVAVGGTILAATDCALIQGETSIKAVNVVSAVVAGMRLPHTVLGVSVSFPGRVVLRDGLVSVPALGWVDDPLRARLIRELGLPVHVVSDSVSAAAFESTHGAGRGLGSVAHLYGDAYAVSGTLTLGGERHTGASGRAGNFGHLIVRPGGAPCWCGGSGCLESETFRLVDASSALQSAGAARLVSEITQIIGNSIDPDLIIFGGSMSDLLEASEKERPTAERGRTTTSISARDTPATLAIGAADIALEAFLADPLGVRRGCG